jgi:hypothetical protein
MSRPERGGLRVFLQPSVKNNDQMTMATAIAKPTLSAQKRALRKASSVSLGFRFRGLGRLVGIQHTITQVDGVLRRIPAATDYLPLSLPGLAQIENGPVPEMALAKLG